MITEKTEARAEMKRLAWMSRQLIDRAIKQGASCGLRSEVRKMLKVDYKLFTFIEEAVIDASNISACRDCCGYGYQSGSQCTACGGGGSLKEGEPNG